MYVSCIDPILSWFTEKQMEPILDVGCGDGSILERIMDLQPWEKIAGLDKEQNPFFPPDVEFIHADFFDWWTNHKQDWIDCKTVILSMPTNSPDLVTRPSRALGDMVVQALLDHQTLILITPNLYHSVSVAGTQWMWNYIFDSMKILKQERIDQPHMAYMLQRGDPTGTREAMLEGHGLWELKEEQKVVLD